MVVGGFGCVPSRGATPAGCGRGGTTIESSSVAVGTVSNIEALPSSSACGPHVYPARPAWLRHGSTFRGVVCWRRHTPFLVLVGWLLALLRTDRGSHRGEACCALTLTYWFSVAETPRERPFVPDSEARDQRGGRRVVLACASGGSGQPRGRCSLFASPGAAALWPFPLLVGSSLLPWLVGSWLLALVMTGQYRNTHDLSIDGSAVGSSDNNDDHPAPCERGQGTQASIRLAPSGSIDRQASHFGRCVRSSLHNRGISSRVGPTCGRGGFPFPLPGRGAGASRRVFGPPLRPRRVDPRPACARRALFFSFGGGLDRAPFPRVWLHLLHGVPGHRSGSESRAGGEKPWPDERVWAEIPHQPGAVVGACGGFVCSQRGPTPQHAAAPPGRAPEWSSPPEGGFDSGSLL